LPLLAKQAWQPNLATAHLEKVTVTQRCHRSYKNIFAWYIYLAYFMQYMQYM